MTDYSPTEDHVRVAERCLELRQDVSRLEVQHVEDTAEIERQALKIKHGYESIAKMAGKLKQLKGYIEGLQTEVDDLCIANGLPRRYSKALPDDHNPDQYDDR